MIRMAINKPDSTKKSDKSLLKFKELCILIELGDRHNLSKLKFGEVEIDFGKPAKSAEKALIPSPTPTAEEMAAIQIESKQQLVSDELATRDDQIEQMLIEDPSKAEEMIADGELDADDEPTDESGNGD